MRTLRALLVFVVACGSMRARRGEPAPVARGGADSSVTIAEVEDAGAVDASDDAEASAAGPIEPDGNDELAAAGDEGRALPVAAHFERVGRAPLSLQRICDLKVHDGALYAAHANQPLGTDGATLTRYDRNDAAKPFRVAFDWNRPGEPTGGGGAGQGFLRIRRIEGRLFVPDSDPPYNGFGITEGGTEGFVFVSDAAGRFAPARAPHFRPPAIPSADGGAGAGLLPRAYHVLDVVRFRGKLYASTGSVPPKEKAWSGPSPGALHRADPSLARWTYDVDYPHPWRDGVWRLTFMTRFRDRLYAGIQEFSASDPNDYVYIAPSAADGSLARQDVHPVRVVGAAQTLRWFTDRGRLYWIALERGRGARLRVTSDGDTWTLIDAPADAGSVLDVARFRGALVALTERGLYELSADRFGRRIASVADKKSPFGLTDFFCAAPIAVYDGDLYAGGQRDGALYRLVDDGAPSDAGAAINP